MVKHHKKILRPHGVDRPKVASLSAPGYCIPPDTSHLRWLFFFSCTAHEEFRKRLFENRGHGYYD